MQRDEERIARVGQALKDEKLDAVVCALPENVLMLTGYWPVVGTSIALATRDGEVELLVPEDEYELASYGYADRITTFAPSSLEDMSSPAEAATEPLSEICGRLDIENK